jgi:hypothetical protein
VLWKIWSSPSPPSPPPLKPGGKGGSEWVIQWGLLLIPASIPWTTARLWSTASSLILPRCYARFFQSEIWLRQLYSPCSVINITLFCEVPTYVKRNRFSTGERETVFAVKNNLLLVCGVKKESITRFEWSDYRIFEFIERIYSYVRETPELIPPYSFIGFSVPYMLFQSYC